MLIVTSKSPGWGKQKPKQWGPLSAVQSAVRNNCENFLGIPFESLKHCTPLWEGAGANIVDVASNTEMVLEAGATWSHRGLDFTAGRAVGAPNFSPTSGSFNVAFSYNTLNADSKYIVSHYNAGNRIYLYQANGNIFTRLGSSSPIDTGKTLATKTLYTATLVWESGIYTVLLNGEIIDSGSYTGLSSIGTELQFSDVDSTNQFLEGDLFSFSSIEGVSSLEPFYKLAETPYALLQPTPQISYFDFAAASGGSSKTAPTAWRIFSTKQKATGWKILTSADKATGWKIYDAASTESAWSIYAKDTLDSAWSIFNSATTETEWSIYTTAAKETAWAILQAGSLSVNTAWKIYNEAAAATAWTIQTQAQLDTAWAIINSGASAISTAWKIYNTAGTESSWKIFTSASSDSSWKIYNTADAATTWKILASISASTEWAIYNAAEVQTAWALNSDLIPEPVQTFLAKSRTVAFNAKSRTVIFFE